MVEIWFGILSAMIVIFIVLDGWDFGAGALHYIVARNQDERRTLIAALGPLWSWHEVWLVGTGGVLFVAFPRVLATGFPAFYLALFLFLWTLILRGISLEFRGHVPHPMWRSFWDFVIAVSNTALAVLFGAAVGNVIRGMPIAPDTPLSLPLFTDFGVRGKVGILDWYTLSLAVFSLICLSAHGASYLALKTDGEVHRRSVKAAKLLWVATVVLLAGMSLETFYVRPELFSGMASRPLAWAAVAGTAGGLIAIFTGLRSGSERGTFAGGCALIAGLLGTAAASLFPVMLHSTLGSQYSITAFNGSSDIRSLRTAIYWWPIAFSFALTYFAFIGRHYAGRVQLSKDTQRPY
jgi:cytochrome d ubiquinol oxidase subunit II